MIQDERNLTVSIIIPVCNVSAYIERCIKSVIRQTYDRIECVVVDDKTPDDSIIKCEQLIANYEGPIDFVILHHEWNRGVSAARNTGTAAATGDYVFYLDGDDEITQDCIEKMLRPVIKDSSIEMVLGNYEVYSQLHLENPIRQRCQPCLPQGDYNSKIKVKSVYKKDGKKDEHAWNKLIRKDFLQQNNLYFKEGVMWEDMIWCFITVQHLNHLYIIPDVTLLYYVRPQSIMTGTSKEEMAHHLTIVYEEISRHFSSEDKGWEAKNNLRGLCSVLMYNYNSQTARRTAQRFMDALSDGPYVLERSYLRLAIFLSKFSLGRTIFVFALNARKVFRKIIVKMGLT